MFVNRLDGKITEASYCEQYEGQEYLTDDSEELQEFLRKPDHINFLNATDWQVIRHRDQLAMNISTSLTEQEYLSLLTQRQVARNKITD